MLRSKFVLKSGAQISAGDITVPLEVETTHQLALALFLTNPAILDVWKVPYNFPYLPIQRWSRLGHLFALKELVSYYIDISPNYSLNIPKTAVLSLCGLGPGA
jgi:hypothetical protein